MACNHATLKQGNTYTTAEGKQFSARVQASPNVPNQVGTWSSLLNRNYVEVGILFHNIPNGAGPGTLVLTTYGCTADWDIVDTRDRVVRWQRAYTGLASSEQIHIEDGGKVLTRVQGIAPLVNADGIMNALPVPGPALAPPLITSQWYPAGAKIPSFDRLSLMTGPASPLAANGFPMRSLTTGNAARFAPPGLCRFFTYTGPAVDLNILYVSTVPAVAVTYATQVGVTNFAWSIPAWGVLEVDNNSGSTIDYIINWNRYPMTTT